MNTSISYQQGTSLAPRVLHRLHRPPPVASCNRLYDRHYRISKLNFVHHASRSTPVARVFLLLIAFLKSIKNSPIPERVWKINFVPEDCGDLRSHVK